MSGPRTVTININGDDSGLADATEDAVRHVRDFEDASEESGNKVARANEKIEGSISKFRGSADIIDGASTAFQGLGLTLPGPIDGALQLTRGIADLADGFVTALGPTLEKMAVRFGILQVATEGQTVATEGQAVAQKSLNLAFLTSPVGIFIAAVVALTAAFVVAYKKSETFRDIVKGALGAVRSAFSALVDAAKSVASTFASVGKKAADAFTAPARAISAVWRAEFNLISDAWNNTIGRLHFHVPSIGIGPFKTPGFSVDAPTLPHFAAGGIMSSLSVVGERGPELAFPATPTAVVPNGAELELHINATGPTLEDIVDARITTRLGQTVARATARQTRRLRFG